MGGRPSRRASTMRPLVSSVFFLARRRSGRPSGRASTVRPLASSDFRKIREKAVGVDAKVDARPPCVHMRPECSVQYFSVQKVWV